MQQLAIVQDTTPETTATDLNGHWIGAADLALEVLQAKRAMTVAERQSLRSFLSAPAPFFEPCTRAHFDKCLRTLALLPRQRDDDVKGEVRLKAMWRKLGHYSEHQWSMATSHALDVCQWFPTIREMRKMLDTFQSPEARYHSAIGMARKALSEDFLRWFHSKVALARAGDLEPEDLLRQPARVRHLFVEEGVFTAEQLSLT